MQNEVVPLFPVVCKARIASLKHYGAIIICDISYNTDDVSNYRELIYRFMSLRYVITTITIHVILIPLIGIGNVTFVCLKLMLML